MKYNLSKPSSEIVEPDAIAKGWYLMKVVKEPQKMKNKKMQDGGERADGAGFNLVFNLRIEDEDPDINGRGFRFIATLPNPSDQEKTTNNGMSMVEFKESQLVKLYAALTGVEKSDDVDVEAVEFTPGMKAYFYVERELSREGDRYVNFTSLNAGARVSPPEEVESVPFDDAKLEEMFDIAPKDDKGGKKKK